MKTKIQIIEETAEFYNLSNRAMVKGFCYYMTEDMRMCAVGRCLLNPEEYSELIYTVHKMHNLYGTLDSLLKEEYRGHDIDFWSDLQCLHDNDKNWTNEGLSEDGQKEVNFLLKEYAEE